jgi:hypothetical protein
MTNRETAVTILNALEASGVARNYGTKGKHDWQPTPQDTVLSPIAAELGLDF